METESVFFYVRCARPTRLCKPELNLLKSGKKTLFNWEYGDKEGPSWSNTKSLKTWHDKAYKKPENLARYKSNIQKALTTQNA